MLLVYSDWKAYRQGCMFLEGLGIPYRLTVNLDEYLSTPADIKLAISNSRFGKFFSTIHYQEFVNTVNNIAAQSDAVVLIESELHQESCFYSRCRSNVHWVIPGIVNTKLDNQFFSGAWLERTRDLYRQLPDKLSQLDPLSVKPKYFDALLGMVKPHRTFVFNSVGEHRLADKIIETYSAAKQDFLYESGTVRADNNPDTTQNIVYEGIDTTISQVIPIGIYNQTAYTIVTETDTDNEFSFFTEKIAKPLIARRLFVVFSGQHYLQNLRSLGFKTFDGIIDETYDTIENAEHRFISAFQQVKRLCEMNQSEVLAQINEIVNHNHQMIMNGEWGNMVRQYPADVVKNLTNK